MFYEYNMAVNGCHDFAVNLMIFKKFAVIFFKFFTVIFVQPYLLSLVFTVYIYVCLLQLYRIVSICIGSPPETVTWEFYDKDKQYHKIGPMTPLEFYQQYVQPHFNVSDKVPQFYCSIVFCCIQCWLVFGVSCVCLWVSCIYLGCCRFVFVSTIAK